jgi:hypothetical protein
MSQAKKVMTFLVENCITNTSTTTITAEAAHENAQRQLSVTVGAYP